MEALIELFVRLFVFVIEVTVHALVFLFLLAMAIFSPAYRQKLRERWDTSIGHRFAIVLGIGLYSMALAIALFVWIPRQNKSPEEEEEEVKPVAIEFSSEELKELGKTKAIEELVDMAGDLIKKKLDEREEPEPD